MTLKSVLLFVDPVFSPPARGQHLYREKIDQLKDTYSQIALILIKNSEILTQFAIQRNLTLFRKMKAIYDLSEASELLFNTNGSFKNNSLFCFEIFLTNYSAMRKVETHLLRAMFLSDAFGASGNYCSCHARTP